jgi:Tat protein secretion system quality control protein TatD with DNase activity
MKITIEPYSGGEITGLNEAEHILEVVQLFKGLLVAAGYHPKTVDEYFNTEETWFIDEEEDNS